MIRCLLALTLTGVLACSQTPTEHATPSPHTPTATQTPHKATPRPKHTPASRTRPTPRTPIQKPLAAILACIARYESGGNYRAVSPDGKYRGAFQFDQPTWNAVAARTNRRRWVGIQPDRAPRAIQDAMAAALYQDRGLQPWSTTVRGQC